MRILNGDSMSNIKDIEGIGPVYAKKLTEAGIKTTDDLLKLGATANMREALGKKTGIEHKLILEWVNLADLYRIKGVGSEYSDLLEEAGVDTIVELAKRVPENLYAKMVEVNEAKKLVRRPPPLTSVKNWVEQAKKLKRVVEY
jgi:predicted flap endonuclease-1-like 5' DNA nuclease